MRYGIGATVVALLLIASLSGCTDLKPLENDVASLKSQLTRLQSDLEANRRSAEEAASVAKSASQTAGAAQGSAEQALQAAQNAQAEYKTVDEKIDRAFKHSISK